MDPRVFEKNCVFTRIVKVHENFPFITVSPICARDTWFDYMETLSALVLELSSSDFVDPSRLYLTGASMGGYATWQLAMSMPGCFAAIIPVCGGGMYWNAARLAGTPVWAFHGALDDAVLVEESIKMVDAVNNNGGSAKLTVYPNNTHDAWNDTYSNPEVFEWLLEHVNDNKAIINDRYADSKLYG